MSRLLFLFLLSGCYDGHVVRPQDGDNLTCFPSGYRSTDTVVTGKIEIGVPIEGGECVCTCSDWTLICNIEP